MKSLIALTLLVTSAHAYAYAGNETGNSVSTHAPMHVIADCIDFDAADVAHSQHEVIIATPDQGVTYFMVYKNLTEVLNSYVPQPVVRTTAGIPGAPVVFKGENEKLSINYSTAPLPQGGQIGHFDIKGGPEFDLHCEQ